MKTFVKIAAVMGLFAIVLPMLAGAQVRPPSVPGEPVPITANENTVYSILDRVISIVFYILMFLAVLFILYAAFKYLTAGGNPENVETAQRMLLYAIIAIVIAVLARSIPFIVASFVGSNIQ